ncbi:MAG: sulfatase-like hydrolase/transferase [Thermoguttaceae bacterium]
MRTKGGSMKFVLAFSAAQFLLHAWFALSAGDPRMAMPHLAAWLLDVFLLMVAAAAMRLVAAGAGRCGIPERPCGWAADAAVCVLGLSLAIYPGLLPEFLAFPTSVFRADGSTGWFFVTEYLGWMGLWPLLVSLAAMTLAVRVRWQPPSRRRLCLMVTPVILLSTPILMTPAPQPLVYSVQDLLKGWLLGGRRIVPSLARPPLRTSPVAPSGEGLPRLDDAQLRYDHVLLLVLEGVTASRFEQEFMSRRGGYCDKLRDCSAYFSGYHTSNLDSYTSLIAMLTSVQVPYRAYANPPSYDRVNESPNLVAALGRRGYATLYISTSEYKPYVPVRKDWTRTMGMRDLPQQEGWVKVGGNKVEIGLEDRAATPAILDFVASHPKTLVMHELLFGHSPRWMAKTGKSQSQYDDEYLLELLDGLEKKKLLDRTLLVVLSDHGDRADSANVANYRVPLLISGRGIRPSQSAAMLSHLDLPRLLGHFLAGDPLPPSQPSLLTVGSTERWVYGEITSSGYLFIDNDAGAVLAKRGELDARNVRERFQGQLNDFAARHGR